MIGCSLQFASSCRAPPHYCWTPFLAVGLQGYGVNTNAFVPNPALRTPLALSMHEFIGKLMGLSLRSKVRS